MDMRIKKLPASPTTPMSPETIAIPRELLKVIHETLRSNLYFELADSTNEYLNPNPEALPMSPDFQARDAVFLAGRASLDAEVAALKAELQKWQDDYSNVADAICPTSTDAQDLANQARKLRASLTAAHTLADDLAGALEKATGESWDKVVARHRAQKEAPATIAAAGKEQP